MVKRYINNGKFKRIMFNNRILSSDNKTILYLHSDSLDYCKIYSFTIDMKPEEKQATFSCESALIFRLNIEGVFRSKGTITFTDNDFYKPLEKNPLLVRFFSTSLMHCHKSSISNHEYNEIMLLLEGLPEKIKWFKNLYFLNKLNE